MNATTSASVDMEDREAQTSYNDSLLMTMRQVHSQIEQLEVGYLTISGLTLGTPEAGILGWQSLSISPETGIPVCLFTYRM